MRAVIAAEKGEENDDIPDEPPPLHHDINYVAKTWMEHKLHDLYPAAGGLDDQDALLVKDWETFNTYYVRTSKGITSALPTPTDAGNWLDLMGD